MSNALDQNPYGLKNMPVVFILGANAMCPVVWSSTSLDVAVQVFCKRD